MRQSSEDEAGRGEGKPGGSSEVECQGDGTEAVKKGKTWEPGTREEGVGGCQGLGVQKDEEDEDDHPSKIDGAGGGTPGDADEESCQFED